MPVGARFRLGIRFDQLYASLPVTRRSQAGSWTQRIPAMGFRLESTYCAHKNDINHEIAKQAPHPNKAFYICAVEAKRKFPDYAERLTRAIDTIQGASSELAQSTATTDASRGSEPAVLLHNPPSDGTIHVLREIILREEEKFIGADGQPLTIRIYGERTKANIRFDSLDMYASFKIQRSVHVATIEPMPVRIDMSGVVFDRTAFDMWQFLELIVHFKRCGNENAKLVYDWVTEVVFTSQYGDGVTLCQADHAAGVGDSLPSEFGKDVCGSYAYSFLEGSVAVTESFPCLANKVAELGIADEPWSLWKNGHTEHMRGRLQASDVKAMLAIHPDARISRGHFWHVPTKPLAAKVEGSVRSNVISQYRVVIPEHDSMIELFVLPHSKEDWLREEGQTIASATATQACDKSEVATLRQECKHRDQMTKLRDDTDVKIAEKDATIMEKDALLAEKDAQITKLREEKMKIAHAAARTLCPRAKLATLDLMFQT